jgi:Protein of unknown function (DUF3631)/Toprim domain
MNFQQPILTPVEIVRLNTWAVEFAEEARGSAHDAGKGDWRIGDSRSLIVHPGALFYDFAAGAGGRGALALIKLLHNCDEAAAGKLARDWLADHSGEGRLSHELADDEDMARAADDAQRIAEIETLWEHRQGPENTPVETYLSSRDLAGSCDSLGWLPNLRGGEGALIAAVTDPSGKLVAVQLTYLTADGTKSPVKPQREAWRGPHDWAARGVVWLSPCNGSGEITVCEGVEDGLSLVEAGAANVAAILGIGRLGKVRWPWGARKLLIARDDDPPGSSADNALYRGVIRQRGEGLMAYILPRPRMIAPDATVPIKDANDLYRYDLAKIWEWLNAPAIGPEDLGPEARNAALDEVSRLSDEQYERARKATAPTLGFGRVNALDKARTARIAERQATQKDDDDEEEVWPDPITDIGEVLDDAVVEVSRYIKATPAAIDTVVLWAAGAHVQQRADLHINIAPRVYVTSPVPGCGKTLLLEIIAAFTPRSMMLSSTSMSGLFREIDARKPTLCLDEFDKQMAGASQEHLAILDSGHRRTSAYVLRSAKTEDGQFIREKFSTFTAMAFSGIRKLPCAMTSRCIIVALQRAGGDDKLEHLVDGASEKLTEIRRKLARWAKDVSDLPMVDRPPALSNRLGDNWYTIRRIARLAGETWYGRAFAAAVQPAMAADTNITLALLDSIWRAFDETKRSRMHTAELLSELLDMDEGRWREARHGQPITAYYLRDNLGDMLPSNADEIAPRRWRDGSTHQQYGYDLLHFKEAFQRYLGKGLPGMSAEKEAAPHSTQDDPKTSVSSVPSISEPETALPSDTYPELDANWKIELDTAWRRRGRRLARMGLADPDPSQASSTVSGSEKHEENEAAPADETDEADEKDGLEGLRAALASEPSKHLKGTAGRKRRKT